MESGGPSERVGGWTSRGGEDGAVELVVVVVVVVMQAAVDDHRRVDTDARHMDGQI